MVDELEMFNCWVSSCVGEGVSSYVTDCINSIQGLPRFTDIHQFSWVVCPYRVLCVCM